MGALFARLKRLASSPRAPVAIVLTAVALALPTISNGTSADDYWHKLSLTDIAPAWAPMKSAWWNLFLFFDGAARNAWLREMGLVPWWTDDAVRIVFFRPLSCLTHALDYALWPASPWLMHAQSVAWYGALVAVAGWTYRRLFERLDERKRWVSNLAAFFYAVDYTHGLPVSWIANRNALVAGVFALAALGAHEVGSRTDPARGRARWIAASAVFFALGLCSGESTLAVGGYLAAHAVWLDERPARARLLALVPHASVLAVWAAAYRAGGFGAKGSSMYIEPLREPLLYVASVLQAVPLLVSAELGAPPPDLYVFLPTPFKVAFLVVALLFLAWASFALLRLWRASALARALFGGGVLSVLPACATFPSARLLVIPSFGLVAAVALAFGALVDDERWLPDRGSRRALARSYLVWSGLGHLFLCPLAFQAAAQQMPVMASIVSDLSSDLPSAEPIPERVVIVNAPDSLFVAFVLAERSLNGQPGPARMLVLAAGQRDLRISRESADTIVVEQEGVFYRVGTEVILRTPSTPMLPGTHLTVGDVGVDVLETTPDGIARRARFHFASSPEDPKKLAFRRWRGGRLEPFALPAVGETTIVEGQLLQLGPAKRAGGS